MLDPLAELRAFLGSSASGLMRQIGSDVAVDKNDLAFVQGRFEPGFCLESITRIQQRREMRIDGLERAQLAVQELPHHLPEPRIVLWEACRIDMTAVCAKHIG